MTGEEISARKSGAKTQSMPASSGQEYIKNWHKVLYTSYGCTKTYSDQGATGFYCLYQLIRLGKEIFLISNMDKSNQQDQKIIYQMHAQKNNKIHINGKETPKIDNFQ